MIKILLRKNSKIIVHDPKATKNVEHILMNKITYANSLSEALQNSQCVVIMTPWKVYTKLNSNDFQKMKKKLVIDTRRILSGKNLNVEYLAIGLGLN